MKAIQKIPRAAVLACLALLAGTAAAIFLAQYVRSQVQAIEEQSKLTMVQRIVAARDMPAGTRLGDADLAVRDFPSQWAGSDLLAASRYTELKDHILSTPIMAGDAMTLAHVQQPRGSFAQQLAPGRRAITLAVDQVNSISGLLKPGDLIDLYVSFEYQRKRLTTPLLQGVQVLATGSETNDSDSNASDSGGYSTLTLDTAPEDVIKLVAARQAGNLTAILRHPADASADRLAARGDLAALLGVANAPIQPVRKAVILYGSAGAKNIPAWARAEKQPQRPGNGWFDMPPEANSMSLNASALPADVSNTPAGVFALGPIDSVDAEPEQEPGGE